MHRFTREQLLSLARDIAQTYGESLTLTAFRRETGLSQHLIFDLCGSWCELRTAIGLTPEASRSRSQITDSAILEKLRSAIAEHGENLSESRFCQLTGFSGTMLSRRFGTWGQLRQLVGLSPRARVEPHYTDEQIFQDIFQVIERIRRRPTYGRYNFHGGCISAQTIRARFGTWNNALQAFETYLERYLSEQTSTPLFRRPSHGNAPFHIGELSAD